MILVYLFFAIAYLRKSKKRLCKIARQNVMLLLIIAIIGMFAYELYVEYAVGWQYGIPQDDDTGWIFRAATAIKDGTSWDRLFLLAHNAEWNDSRVLSISTLGQYIYAIFVATALYFPTVLHIKVNLYLLYIFQILLVSSAIIECAIALEIEYADVYGARRPSKSGFFFLMFFYPVVLFNTYKILREDFFVFFSLKTFLAFVQARKGHRSFCKLVLYSICLVLIRPNSIILVFSLVVWSHFGERIAFTSGLVLSALLLAGTFIISKVTQILGWGYGFGTVQFNELIHLLLFPSPVSQAKNFLQIGANPSWVTVLYFAQSIWNIPILCVCTWGILHSFTQKKNLVWVIIWLNSLMVYSLAYSIENMTPRYKLIYLIPQMVFLYIGMIRIKSTCNRQKGNLNR